MKKIITSVFIILLLGANLFAQEEKNKRDTLEYKYPFEVLITAPRFSIPLKESPFATSIVDKDLLNIMPRSLAADEPFKLVPGIKIDNQADGERLHLSIRGQGILSERGFRGTKVFLDGIPLNDPAGYTPDFYDVQWPRIQNIELLRGAASSLFGGSATSGIININTVSSPHNPYSGNGFFSSGTFNTWQAYGLVGTGWKNGDANVSYAREMGDGYRIHTNFWASKLWAKVDYNVTKNIHLIPVGGYIDFYNQNPEGLNRQQVIDDERQANPDAVPKNEFMHTQRYTAGLSGVVNATPMHSFLFSGFVRGTKYSESVPSNILHRTMTTPGGSIQYNLTFGNKKIKNIVSIGADIQAQNIDEYRRQNMGGGIDGPVDLSNDNMKQTGYGGFIADRVEIDSKWSAMLNVRYDEVKNELTDNMRVGGVDLSGSKNFHRPTGRVGVTYTPNKNWSIFADYGTGFLPPATEELDANPDAYGGFNNNLTFATSQGPELGVRGAYSNKLYFDLTGFYLQTKDDFNRFRKSNRPLETFYNNIPGSKRFGAEFYAKIDPIKYITFQMAYTYSNFKYTDITDPIPIIMDDTSIHKYIENDKFLPNSPEHQFMVDLQINILKNLSVGLNSETYSRSYIDGANNMYESVGGFTLYGARVTYSTAIAKAHTEVSIFARNIFSRKYIAFTEPDPGGNSYQPGTPAQVYLNVKVGF